MVTLLLYNFQADQRGKFQTWHKQKPGAGITAEYPSFDRKFAHFERPLKHLLALRKGQTIQIRQGGV
jgi:hypothetical protein